MLDDVGRSRHPGRELLEPGWRLRYRRSADGPWLGTVAMPPDVRPLEIGADYLLGVQTDELDVQHLMLYDLER